MENQTVIVTGAAAGIGRTIADRFVEIGANVVYADIRESVDGSGTLAQGERTAFYQLDVSSPEQVGGLIEFTRQRFGGLGVMVNNAGVVDYATVQETSNELWQRLIAVNLSGVFYGTRAAANQMIAQGNGGGAIVNIGSIAGVVGFTGLAAYCAVKGGVTQLTKASALDLAPHRIRVNAVAPGPVESNMTRPQMETEDFQNMLEQNVPLKRIGRPEEIAAAVLHLASPEAGYTTGQIFSIDGGWTAR